MLWIQIFAHPACCTAATHAAVSMPLCCMHDQLTAALNTDIAEQQKKEQQKAEGAGAEAEGCCYVPEDRCKEAQDRRCACHAEQRQVGPQDPWLSLIQDDCQQGSAMVVVWLMMVRMAVLGGISLVGCTGLVMLWQ